jgi:predicted O-methyltransferase YrrM
MHHSEFIKTIATIYKPNTYLELGLYHGETFSKVIPYATKLYGIDLSPNPHLEALRGHANVHIMYETTNHFFENFNEGIDMAFIDADHSYESVKQDLEHVLNRLNPNGIVILHDTDPIHDHYIQPGYCGDCYKIVNYLEERNDINIVTLPIEEAGLSMVTKKNNTRTQLRKS